MDASPLLKIIVVFTASNGIHLLGTLVALDVGSDISFGQPDSWIGGQLRERRVQCLRGRQFVGKNLIKNPEDTMDLDLAGLGKSSEQGITAK